MCILNAEVGSNFEQQKCELNSDSNIYFFLYSLQKNNAIRS